MTENDVQALAREYPDWQPWLLVIEAVVREATESNWESYVPPRAEPQAADVPLLAGVTIAVDLGKVRRWQQRLLQTAARSGAPKMSSLTSVEKTAGNTAALFEAALCEDGRGLKRLAGDLGVDADAFSAVSLLIPMPFLHACNRRSASLRTPGWTAGYCPTCGAWPTFAEVRGIERSRYSRCGRCGAEWQAHGLFCSYCGNTDHKELGSLVPENSGSARAIDTCNRCRGYLKTFTKLQGSAAPKIMLDDLASVDLDIAALEQGFKRPPGPGYALNCKVVAKQGLSERLFGRNL
jgi:FdhE protein